MDAKSLKSFWIVSVCALTLTDFVTITSASNIRRYRAIKTFNYTHLQKSSINDQIVLVNENRSCPRDCVCYGVFQGYRTAECIHLEMGIQTFGEDITDLVIDKAEMDIQLGDFVFKNLGLHQILMIKIVNSNITAVGVYAFQGLQKLYSVNLCDNNIKNIHPETFATNNMLSLLDLSHNPLTFPASDTGMYFLNASSVQEFDISYCDMRYVTNNLFKYLPRLIYINLAGNNLIEIEDDVFKALLDLEYLDLSDNKIKGLSKGIFSDNTELATLNITNNPIDSVDGLQVFNLLALHAGETNIKIIEPSMFNDMTFITYLNLSGNNIEKIHYRAFHKLFELNYLDISFNNLYSISNIIIKENTELSVFTISNNPRLKHLPFDGFNCSARLFEIFLFDASNCGLKEIYQDSLKTFSALEQINLSANNIQSINKRVFSRCPKLAEINLAHNLLTTLDNEIFEKNNDLAILNLQGNPLKVFSLEVFVHTPNLNWLDMSHANLTGLWKLENNQPTELLMNLRFLNVSHNYIIEIKQTKLVTLKNLKTLDIAYNLLACSEEFKNTMNWLSSGNVSSSENDEFTSGSMETVDIFTWDHYIRQICGAYESSTLTLSSVIQSIDEDKEKWKLEDTSDDGNNYNNTENNSSDTKQDAYSEYNEYIKDDENYEYNKDEPNNMDVVKIDKQLNTESTLNTNNNTEHSYVWPITMAVLGAIFSLINIIIFVKYYFKRKNVSRRINLVHQTKPDSQTATGMPLLRMYSFLAE